MNPNLTTIFGPPGCGKTTRLLTIINDLLTNRVSPQDIGFITFTKKAAEEAKYRACEQLRLNPEELKWFRTLHSMAFNRLGLTRDQVLSYYDMRQIAKRIGVRLSFKGVDADGTVTGLEKGDRLFFMEGLSRIMRKSLQDIWTMFPDDDLPIFELEHFRGTLDKYKKANKKVDYTDMLDLFVQEKPSPKLRYLIIDEAQDLSAIQWDMVEIIAKQCEHVWVAGDDDQAIYNWAGAESWRMSKLNGEKEYLTQSYRVPKKVQKLAMTITDRIRDREEKTYLPREDEGKVEYVGNIAQLDMSKGEWLLLGRNLFLLEKYVEYCRSMGYVYDSRIGEQVKNESLMAVVTWEKLRKGNDVPVKDAVAVYNMMSVSIGYTYGAKTKLKKEQQDRPIEIEELQNSFGLATTEIWHKALAKLPPEDAEYFLAARKNGEKLLSEPRIKINTIHGVKGGQADNVVLSLDMAQRTFNESEEDPDSEARVWYVGATRAKQNLYILLPETNYAYTL